jgi:hypothetical protein
VESVESGSGLVEEVTRLDRLKQGPHFDPRTMGETDDTIKLQFLELVDLERHRRFCQT